MLGNHDPTLYIIHGLSTNDCRSAKRHVQAVGRQKLGVSDVGTMYRTEASMFKQFNHQLTYPSTIPLRAGV